MIDPTDAIAARDPNDPVRHAFVAGWPFLDHCKRCGRTQGARQHRQGSRCSMCLRYYKRYELDDSRRCTECAP